MTLSLTNTLPNRLNPGGDPLTFGSTAGADTNDPTRLARPSGNFVWVDSNTSNFVARGFTDVSSPPAPASVCGELRYDIRENCSNWHDPASPQLSRHFDTVGRGSGSAGMGKASTGIQTLVNVGTETVAALSIVTHTTTIPAGWKWLSARFTHNGIGVPPTHDLYASDDGIAWTLVSSLTGSVNATGTGIVFPYSTCTFFRGINGLGTHFRLYVDDNDNTSDPFVSFDASDILPTDTTTVTSGGVNWNVSRSATGLKTALVTQPVILTDAVNDRMVLASPGALARLDADETLLSVVTAHTDSQSLHTIFSTRQTPTTTAQVGVVLRVDISGGTYQAVVLSGDGTSAGLSSLLAGLTVGVKRVLGYRYLHSTREIRVFASDGSSLLEGSAISLAALGSFVTADNPTVGSATLGAGSSALEFHAPLLRSATRLSDTQLLELCARLIAGDYA